MKNNLLVSLIDKDIVQEGTEIVIFRVGDTMNGHSNFKVEQAVEVVETEIKNGNALLKTESAFDHKIFLVGADHIFKIDGMWPEILGDVYGFNPDGTKKKVKIDPETGEEIKRGRKPKKKRSTTIKPIGKKKIRLANQKKAGQVANK